VLLSILYGIVRVLGLKGAASEARIPGFLGEEARTWARRSEAERRHAVIGCFIRSFGEAAGRHEQYLERDWMAEEFTRGCYGAHFAPGV